MLFRSVFHIRRSGFESVDITFYINVGSAYETKENNGISHLLEHQLFARRKEKEFYPFGLDVEAYTSKDVTRYEATISKKYIENITPILSEIVFNPKFDRQTLKTNKEIVVQEIKEELDDPYCLLNQKIDKYLFPGNSISLPTGGKKENIEQMEIDDLEKWYNNFYRPENMVLTIVGDISFNQINDLVKKYFNFSKKQGKAKTNPIQRKEELPLKAQREKRSKVEVSEQFNMSYTALVYPAPSIRYPSFINNLFLWHILNQKFRPIVESSELLYDVEFSYFYNLFHGEYQFTFTSENERVNKIKSMILKFLREVEIDQKTFKKEREYYINKLLCQKDSLGELSSLTSYLLFDPKRKIIKIEDEIKQVEKVSLSKIQKMKNDIFKNNNLYSYALKNKGEN